MLIGRFAFIVPVMAIAGSMVRKKVAPAGPGTFPTNTPLFAGLLVGVILIVGALTYFPAYSLGAIVEQLLMLAGKTFYRHGRSCGCIDNVRTSSSGAQNSLKAPAEAPQQPGRIGSEVAKARRPRGAASLFDPKIITPRHR